MTESQILTTTLWQVESSLRDLNFIVTKQVLLIDYPLDDRQTDLKPQWLFFYILNIL